MTTPIDPAMPADPPLRAALAELAAAGYESQFGARDGARVLCFTCREASAAGAVVVADRRRLEGVSDPADMLYVAALTCPRCGARGTLVVSYGPEASPEDSDVLMALEDQPAAGEA